MKRNAALITSSSSQVQPSSTSYDNQAYNLTDDISNANVAHLPNQAEHRALVKAIFDLGLKAASPASLITEMSPVSKAYKGLNLERIKSKLQKYRNKKDQNKEEFMALYDSALVKFCNDFGNGSRIQPRAALPSIESLGSGEIAAYLTYTVVTEENRVKKRRIVPKFGDAKDLNLPVLTEAEKNSPIGTAFKSLVELFRSLEEELESIRRPVGAKSYDKDVSTIYHPQEANFTHQYHNHPSFHLHSYTRPSRYPYSSEATASSTLAASSTNFSSSHENQYYRQQSMLEQGIFRYHRPDETYANSYSHAHEQAASNLHMLTSLLSSNEDDERKGNLLSSSNHSYYYNEREDKTPFIP